MSSSSAARGATRSIFCPRQWTCRRTMTSSCQSAIACSGLPSSLCPGRRNCVDGGVDCSAWLHRACANPCSTLGGALPWWRANRRAAAAILATTLSEARWRRSRLCHDGSFSRCCRLGRGRPSRPGGGCCVHLACCDCICVGALQGNALARHAWTCGPLEPRSLILIGLPKF